MGRAIRKLRAWERLRTSIALALAYSAEAADTVLLTSMYLGIGRSLKVSLLGLGTLAMYRGLVQAGATPFAGVLGDKCNRRYIVFAGTLLWGCFSAGFGLSRTYSQVSAMAALNGVGLALVMPACQSLIADLYEAQQRGRAFGIIMTVAAFGAMLGTFFATSVGASWIAGIEGWRLAFYVVACISGATGLLVLVSVVEPRSLRAHDPKTPKDEEASLQADAATAKLPGAAPAAGSAELKDGKENVGSTGGPDSRTNGAAKGGTERASEQSLEMSKNSRNAHGRAALGAVAPDNGDRRLAFAAGDQGGDLGEALGKADARALAASSPFYNRAQSAASHGTAPPPEARMSSRPSAVQLGGAVVDMFAGAGRVLGGMLWVMWRMLHIPTFSIIMVEHIIGNLQSISGYKIIYFQLLGFSDVVTGAMSACTTAGVALGFIVGGTLGDLLSHIMPDYARPAVNQFSVLIAAPLAALLYKGMPARAALASGIEGSQNYLAWRYCLLLFFVGSLTSWSAVNNAAILAEVVPSRERSQVYAFDRCIAGLVGALSNVIVPLLAQFVFHYSTKHDPRPEGHLTAAQREALAAENVRQALRLENGLLIVMLVPMLLKLAVYSGLYWTLPRDRVNAAIREARESGLIGPRRSGPAPHEAASGGASTKSKMSAKPDAGEEADVVGELDGGSFRRGRTWHAPGGGRHGAPAHNPFSAADPPPESRMTHPPDSITAQWRATRQALVEQTGADGGAEAAAPAAPAAGGTHPPRPPGIERPPSGPHGRHHSPSPTRTGGGEREHPPAGPHMARVGSGERQRLGRLSASSGGSAAGAQRPAIARQGSVPLRERLTSIQRQGSLAARQGLERMQSAGAAAREQVQRSASIVGASVHRMASHPATFRTTDSDLVRLTSML